MGTVRNFWIMAKSAGGRRALSRADIFSYCEPLIKKPPTPPELLRSMQESFLRYEGNVISLVEYYRRHHLVPALDRIAAEPTWDRQRATCLTEILKETHWTNWQYVFKRAETDGGREIILGKLRKLWPKASNEELGHYLMQFYLVTICTNAALSTLAHTFYGMDKEKELEIRLYEQYGRDIDMLDISIMDLAYKNHADDVDAAYKIADWKDEKLNPLLHQMYRHLTSTQDQIVEGTFVVENFKRVSDKLDSQKAALAKELPG
jgi:hypothetical protein